MDFPYIRVVKARPGRKEGRNSVIAAPGTTCSSFPCYYCHVPIQTVQEGISLFQSFFC